MHVLHVHPSQNEDIRGQWASRVPRGRASISACWASWEDCLPMMFAQHPEVAFRLVRQLEGHPDSPSLAAAVSSARVLSGTMGEGVRPRMLEPDEFEPGIERGGWQHEVPRAWNDSTGKKCSSNGCCLETERVVRVGVWP